ncbi:MAG: PEP/pyruvate-binding domain-containing protein [Oscillospiraceae bacterium]|nr:PEP/pyruvate-binding domain-containing protein [Oscillospiraceae bacterium]
MEINPTVTLENLGGKGYHLNLLRDICNVPEFFVIRFDDLQEIDDEIIQNQILNYYNENEYGLVSVRSSATVEDGEESSFAGMFDSILNVRKEGLIPAIKEVVDSVKGQRVVDYCKLKEIDYDQVAMRVVVQKMVIPRVAGVCFTKTSNSNEKMVIEACFGLGEALVSGKVTPDNYMVDRNMLSIENVSIGFQKIMLKQNEYEDVPFHKRNAKKLSDTEIEELAKVSLHIEENLSYDAVDIEWAYEGSKLYILQARAFTGIN